MLDEIYKVLLNELKMDINFSDLTWIIKTTEQHSSGKIIITFLVRKKPFVVAKIAFNEYGESLLKNEYIVIKEISGTIIDTHIPKLLYFDKRQNNKIMIQEYVQGKPLLSAIANAVAIRNYKLIEGLCLNSMQLLVELHNLHNNKPKKLIDIITPSIILNSKEKSVIDICKNGLEDLLFTPGIFHGDFSADNIIVQFNQNVERKFTMIDWEFSKLYFLKELDALFFCLSFITNIYFRALNIKNKNFNEYLQFLIGENEYTNIARKSLFYYFKLRNMNLLTEQIYCLFLVLLIYLSKRDKDLLMPSFNNQFYKDILSQVSIIGSPRDIKWLNLV